MLCLRLALDNLLSPPRAIINNGCSRGSISLGCSREEKRRPSRGLMHEREEADAGFCQENKMEGGPCKNSSQSARRRRLEIRRLRSDGRTGSAAKGTREPSSDSFSESSSSSPDSSPPSSESSPKPRFVLRPPCLSHGSVSVIGRRREMEDTVTVAPAFATSGESSSSLAYDFFGVYDGHGGARVSEACRERLHVVLAEEMAGERATARRGPEGERWREALAASFSRVDREVALAATSEAAEKTVGSTAVVAVVGPKWIVVANCGDSRAVFSRGGIAVPLSSDHKPDRPDEMERVEAAGGRVINWNGYRVLGVLATSRSIGDYYLKPYVTSEPEVTVTERMEKDEFLILASDGLWDVVSNEVACKLTRQCLSGRAAKMFPESVSGSTAVEAAALLAKLAISRGSKDNISVVVVELKRFR